MIGKNTWLYREDDNHSWVQSLEDNNDCSFYILERQMCSDSRANSHKYSNRLIHLVASENIQEQLDESELNDSFKEFILDFYNKAA